MILENLNAQSYPMKEHFPTESVDKEQDIALKNFQEYLLQPADNKPFVSEETLKERDRLWERWIQICAKLKVDYRKTWIDFVRHPDDPKAQAPFKSFLSTYVETSIRKVAVLGPAEYEDKRMFNSAHSLTEVWRRLVASGEYHVMQQQRKDQPSQASLWRIRWISKEEGHREGPAYRIVRWIFLGLAVQIGLDTKPTYQKVEMTSVDIGVGIETLWTRASDIPCKPVTRVSFHAVLLLAAIGGFRPGTLENLPYSQFQVAILRDPQDRARTKLVITVSITRNKIKERSKTSRARNGNWITFSVTLIPTQTFCLASLILARGIQDNAFEAEFRTVDELFDRPILDSVDFVPLRWKQASCDKPIFPISYNMLRDVWHREFSVAGVRKAPRFYSTRLGSGARMDGVLSSALRNYVLSHTTSVFESSYQTHHIRADLTKLAFGDHTRDEDELFAMLRNISTTRDKDAPIHVTEDECLQFEERNDIKSLRAAIENEIDTKHRSKLRSRLNNLLKTLSRLKLEQNRAAYFERVDLLRAQGSGVQRTDAQAYEQAKLVSMADIISTFVKVPGAHERGDSVARSRQYIETLVGFLTDTPAPTPIKPEGDEDENLGKNRSRCLLCQMRMCSRSALTKHCNTKHTEKTTFSRPFLCPECHRSGTESLIDNRLSWSNHVERIHGRMHAPNWSAKQTLPIELCMLCGAECSPNSLITHINRHLKSENLSWPTPCRLCSDTTNIRLGNKYEFLDHFQEHHAPWAVYCILCGYICSTASGLTRHTSLAHAFEEPYPCPACQALAVKTPVVIQGRCAWQMHVNAAHLRSCYDLTQGPAIEGIAASSQDTYVVDEYDTRMSGTYISETDDTTATGQEPLQLENVDQGRPGSQSHADAPQNTRELQMERYYDDLAESSTHAAYVPSLDLIDPELRGHDFKRLDAADAAHTRLNSLALSCRSVELPSSAMDVDDEDSAENAQLMTQAGTSLLVETKVSPEPMDMEDREYVVDCIVERWRKNLFLLRWSDDGSYWWVPRRNILDQDLVQSFEAGYEGLGLGVTILRTRTRNRKTEYRVRWTGRPESEDTWVQERDLSPEVVRKHKPQEAKAKRRKRRV